MLSATLPQLSSMSNQLTFGSLQQSLISSLIYTRGEGIKNGGQASICPSNTIQNLLTSCSSSLSNWSEGWIVFIDKNNNGIFDPPFNQSSAATARLLSDDEMLRMRHVESTAEITWERNNTLSFMGNGTVPAANAGSFKICDTRGSTSAKGVVINLSGRVRSTNSVTCP